MPFCKIVTAIYGDRYIAAAYQTFFPNNRIAWFEGTKDDIQDGIEKIKYKTAAMGYRLSRVEDWGQQACF